MASSAPDPQCRRDLEPLCHRLHDLGWVKGQNLAIFRLPQFLPLCPDFVVEIRSPSDRRYIPSG
jgi:Uma2 family endonuclease